MRLRSYSNGSRCCWVGASPESLVRGTDLTGIPLQLLAPFCFLLLGTEVQCLEGQQPTITTKMKLCIKNGKAGPWKDLGLDDTVEP